MPDPADRDETLAPETVRLVARVAGCVLVLAFFGLSAIHGGFGIEFRPPFTFASSGETNLWLGQALLLFPAACLIGFGLTPVLERFSLKCLQAVQDLPAQKRPLAVGLLIGIGATLARLLNAVVLRGLPLTDDEYAIRFGGQGLALGKPLVPLPVSLASVPNLFLYARGNAATSLDWVGGQLAWAIAEITRTGPWIFALAAALPLGCLAVIGWKRLGPAWAVALPMLFAFSPMAFALSVTTHAHLLSRASFAAAILAFVMASERRVVGWWIAFGAALGCGFCCRPIEITTLSAPLVFGIALDLSRKKTTFREIFWILLGSLPFLFIFFSHSWLVTHSLIPPRHNSGIIANNFIPQSTWVRFGTNAGYNLFMLAVWFLGPLGLILVSAGVLRDSLTRRLGMGVAAGLAVGLIHDVTGIHAVGPIHYSECAVPLTVIAGYGLAHITRKLRDFGIQPFAIAMTTTALVIGLGIFNCIHAISLNRQTEIQSFSYDALEQRIPPGEGSVVVLAPQFAKIWLQSPAFRETRSWVFEWRKPKPDFSDRILILNDVEGKEDEIRKAFPGRKILRMKPSPDEPFFQLTPLQ